jgi:hypothetical protein
MIVIEFLRNITLVCKERYITESGVGERYRASSAFHTRVRAENNKASSFLLPVSHAALMTLCLGFGP